MTEPQDLSPLPEIPYLRLRVALRAEEIATLPPYHGSMLRGAFGHALRRLACSMGPEQPCAACRLRRSCLYPQIFEIFIEGAPPPFLRGLPTAPSPYVFEPRSDAVHLEPGGELEFDLLLFGKAIDLEAHALFAIERMAAAGLGRGRARFALAGARRLLPEGGWEDLFNGAWNPKVEAPRPCLPVRNGWSGPRAVIHLQTPLRLKSRDRLLDSLTFRDLAFPMIRRTLEIAHFHVPGAEIDWTFRPLLDRASEVEVLRSDLRWLDWERYSNRQQAKMNMGGLVGTLEVEGDLAPFAPLLRTAEVLHLGKGTTFGLGRIELDKNHA